MVVFGVSVAVLLSFIYTATMSEMESQVKSNINIKIAELGRKFLIDGVEDTAANIRDQIIQDDDGVLIFMLINPDWRTVAGNISTWPGGSNSEDGWVKFKPQYNYNRNYPESNAVGRTVKLSGDYMLMVGFNLVYLERIEKIIFRALLGSAFLTIIMSMIGGYLITRNINKRLEVINKACNRVMQGEMNERAEVSGSGDEFDNLSNNFNSMLAKISELLEGVRHVSYNIAHDLRTPLNRVRNRLENLILRRHSIAKSIDEVRLAINEIDNLVATFNSILRISQAESGAGIEQFENFNLSEVMLDLVDLYSALAEEKGIELHSDIEDEVYINGDKHLLTQGLANIVDNAVKYSKRDGESVEIKLYRSDAKVIIEVCDKGLGIPAEFQEKVFEKFFRLETNRTSPGNGLGLSLANAAVKLHSGEIIFSDNNPGLKVSIIIPSILNINSSTIK